MSQIDVLTVATNFRFLFEFLLTFIRKTETDRLILKDRVFFFQETETLDNIKLRSLFHFWKKKKKNLSDKQGEGGGGREKERKILLRHFHLFLEIVLPDSCGNNISNTDAKCLFYIIVFQSRLKWQGTVWK